MNATVAVLRRELADKRRAILFALGFGLVPLIAPVISAYTTGSRSGGHELRDILAIWLASAFFMTAAFLGGVTTIGRDLAERRLSFYFARPISAGALWFGKIAAVVIYAFLFGFAAALPATLFGGGLMSLSKLGNAGVQAVFALTIFCVPFIVVFAHALGISIRSKSPWIALDAALIGALGVFFWTYMRVLVLTQVGRVPVAILAILMAVFALSLVAAGYAQLLRGRTDIRAGHRAMSLTLWTPVVIVVILAMSYISWLGGGTAHDLNQAFVEDVSLRGDWVVVSGPRHFGFGYWNSYLFNPATGESQPIGIPGDAIFSADGSTAVALRMSLEGVNGVSASVAVARLDRKPVRFEPTTISFSGYPPAVGLSPDGSRLATFDGKQMSIIDLARGRSLMTGQFEPVGSWRSARFLFAGPSIVRCYAAGSAPGATPLNIIEMDLASRKVRRTGVATLPRGADYRVAPDGSTILAGAMLFDGVTGTKIRTLGTEDRAASVFLSDGRIALAQPGAAGSVLKIFDRNGEELRSIALPATTLLRPGAELAKGRVVLQPWAQEVWVVGVDDGSVITLPGGGLVATGSRWYRSSDAAGVVAPGSIATRLVSRPNGSLVEIDLSGHERTIIQGRVNPKESHS